MSAPDDEPPGVLEREQRHARSDAAAILGFDLTAGGGRPADDPAAKLRRVVDRARERYDAGQFQAAIGLADKALDLDPGCLRAWRCKAHSLRRLDNLEGAVAELTRARRAVQGEEAVAAVDEMLDAFRRRLTDRPIEEARRRLRDGRPREAVVILEKLAGAVGDDETLDERLTYARERAVAAESRGAVPGTALTLVALQRVLGWLCREETAHGDRALEAEDYRAAAIWFARARKRDDRHTAAALGEATAAYALARVATADFPRTWAGIRKIVVWAAQMLRRADTLAQTAAADRTLAEDAAALRRVVADAITDNDALLRRADKNLAVNHCITDFQALVNQYNKSERNWLTASNLLTSFPPIEARAHRLYRKYGPEDEDVGERLELLRDAVVRLRRDINW